LRSDWFRQRQQAAIGSQVLWPVALILGRMIACS
jgi:hypothetical protein